MTRNDLRQFEELTSTAIKATNAISALMPLMLKDPVKHWPEWRKATEENDKATTAVREFIAQHP